MFENCHYIKIMLICNLLPIFLSPKNIHQNIYQTHFFHKYFTFIFIQHLTISFFCQIMTLLNDDIL